MENDGEDLSSTHYRNLNMSQVFAPRKNEIDVDSSNINRNEFRTRVTHASLELYQNLVGNDVEKEGNLSRRHCT